MCLNEANANEASDVFAIAASSLEKHVSGTDQAHRLLQFLAYTGPDAGPSNDPEVDRNRICLLRTASAIGGVFRLHSRSASGLFFFGGNASPAEDPMTGRRGTTASLNGAGVTARAAFEACIGEGAEYLSQFRRVDDGLITGTLLHIAPWNDARLAERLNAWLAEHADGRRTILEWIAGTRLLDNRAGLLPADLVLRNPEQGDAARQRFSVGSGCAAAPSWEGAVSAALFETIERDAVALWWKGGRAGRPLAMERLSDTGSIDLLTRIRQGCDTRVTTLIDITSDINIPCIAAVSFNGQAGGFAAGFGCNLDPATACRSALVELCQMELGQELVALKREKTGSVSLNDHDLREERRATGIAPDQTCLVEGLSGPVSFGAGSVDADAGGLHQILERLAVRGYDSFAVDLTRPEIGIPVARVIVPGLQPYPSSFVSSRLASAHSQGPNKAPYSNGIDLF